MILGEAERASLADFIAASAAADRVEIRALEPLAGGAIQENWLIDVALTGGLAGPSLAMVLRTDAPSRIAVSHGRAEEFAILKAAFAMGVMVPEPLWLCTDAAVLGKPFYLMRRVPGVAAGHRIVRDADLAPDRDALAERLGRELALLHRIHPPRADLAFLEMPEPDPATHTIVQCRRFLDRLGVPRPALEWGLRWAERNAPDNRTGNYMVDAKGLTGILDWEFAQWGDPMADIGWFCARCWRFGRDDLEAGGIAGRGPFYRGYAAESGHAIEGATVHFWEVMAHIRWAVIASMQAARHISGEQRSLELALTGRLVPELEWQVLQMIEGA
jgi:aminoglycoside phosphotransferase (APT) family kinase protein